MLQDPVSVLPPVDESLIIADFDRSVVSHDRGRAKAAQLGVAVPTTFPSPPWLNTCSAMFEADDKDSFVQSFSSFNEEKGTRVEELVFNDENVDLFALYDAVISRGGLEKVTVVHHFRLLRIPAGPKFCLYLEYLNMMPTE